MKTEKKNPLERTGGYSLHLYCKYENEAHEYDEFPHEISGITGSKARKEARKRGWILHRDGTSTCPKCSDKEPKITEPKGAPNKRMTKEDFAEEVN